MRSADGGASMWVATAHKQQRCHPALQTTNALSHADAATNTDLRAHSEHTRTIATLRRAVMDVLDGAKQLSPDMNEEAQRWLEITNNRKRSKQPALDEQVSSNKITERSPNAQTPATSKSPPFPLMLNESSNLQADRSTFEESFTAALTRSPMTYDGHFDRDDEDGDEIPLLNSYYKALQSPQQAVHEPSNHAPLEPPSKSKPSRSICLWNQVSHHSQYTRPAADILREVLEVRYPVTSTSAGYEQLHENGDAQCLLSGSEARSKRRWWNKLLRRRATG